MRTHIDDNAKNIHLLNCNWGDVLLFQELLRAEAQSGDNPLRHERAANLLAGLDLAIESKIDPALPAGSKWRDLPWE